MPTITVKLDDELLTQVDTLACKKGTNRSEMIRQALSEHISGVHSQYDGIPQEIKDKVAFIRLLVLDGTPDKDWELVQREVSNLWIDML